MVYITGILFENLMQIETKMNSVIIIFSTGKC